MIFFLHRNALGYKTSQTHSNKQPSKNCLHKVACRSSLQMSSPNPSFNSDVANRKMRRDMTSFVKSPRFFKLVLGKNDSRWNRALLKSGLIILDLYSWLVSFKFCLQNRLRSKKSNFRWHKNLEINLIETSQKNTINIWCPFPPTYLTDQLLFLKNIGRQSGLIFRISDKLNPSETNLFFEGISIHDLKALAAFKTTFPETSLV